MYIPAFNKMQSNDEAIDFMRRFSFAIIVTLVNEEPIATHLPFFIEQRNEKLILCSHFAKANTHWQHLQEQTSLVIFSEPHAYISPSNYDHRQNVPTWNYMAVHAYGKACLLPESADAMLILEKTITYYEPAYMEQWNTLPEDYKLKMLRGIVAFEMEVERLEAKEKLSQNRNGQERAKISQHLSASASTFEQLIAEYMRKKDLHLD